MIFLLLLMLVGLELLIFAFKKDILSPSFLFCFGYLFSVVSALINIDSWHLNISGITVLYIISAVLAFSFGEAICDSFRRKKYIPSVEEVTSIRYSKSMLYLLVIFDIFVFIIFYINIRFIAIRAGSDGSFWTIASYYRHAAYYTSLGDANLNIIILQFVKVLTATRYICIYMFIRNTVSGEKVKDNILLLIPVAISILQTLLNGTRMSLITMCVFSVFVYTALYRKKKGWNKIGTNFKFIKNAAVVMLALFVAFYLLKTFVGRVTELNFVSYITSYSGGSIPLLNDYLNGYRMEKVMGQETFAAFFSFLAKFRIVPDNVRHLEFRLLDSKSILNTVGNVYTGIRRYSNDFGYLGVCILPFIMGIVFENMYYKIKYTTLNKKRNEFRVILYAYMLYAVILNSIDDVFFSEIVSIGMLLQFVLMRMVFWVLTEVKIRCYR